MHRPFSMVTALDEIYTLSTATNLTGLNTALKILERHDLAACDQEKWRISIDPYAPKAIKIFRRWVIDRRY
jgi:hypothetical protein